MPTWFWSRPGTELSGDKVGILSSKTQLHLWFWLGEMATITGQRRVFSGQNLDICQACLGTIFDRTK